VRELREWRATNLPTVPFDSGEAGEPSTADKIYRLNTPARTTKNPKEMWATHLTQSKIQTTKPQAPLDTSTESDWNELLRRLDIEEYKVRDWANMSGHCFDDGHCSCECGREYTVNKGEKSSRHLYLV